MSWDLKRLHYDSTITYPRRKPITYTNILTDPELTQKPGFFSMWRSSFAMPFKVSQHTKKRQCCVLGHNFHAPGFFSMWRSSSAMAFRGSPARWYILASILGTSPSPGLIRPTCTLCVDMSVCISLSLSLSLSLSYQIGRAHV